MTTEQQQPWHTRPGGHERLAFEMARLGQVPSVSDVDVRDLATGSTSVVVHTHTPPGYTLYIQTSRDYPHTPPALLLERGDAPMTFSSRVITTWQPTNTLAQIVNEVVGGALNRRVVWLGLAFALCVGVILVAGVVALASGQNRITQVNAVSTAQAYATALGNGSDSLNTVGAQATARVSAAPGLAGLPNPTITAAVQNLLDLRRQNAAALATVTVVGAANTTATAQAIGNANSQTQSAWLSDQTAQAQTASTATALAVLIAPTPTLNPLPPSATTPNPPKPTHVTNGGAHP